MYADPQTLRRLEDDYVGFWVQYRYEEGYGGQLSLGLNGAPFSADFAILRWTDTSTTALKAVKFLGFTNGDTESSIDYGANCVLLKTSIPNTRNPYSQVKVLVLKLFLQPQKNSRSQHNFLNPCCWEQIIR